MRQALGQDLAGTLRGAAVGLVTSPITRAATRTLLSALRVGAGPAGYLITVGAGAVFGAVSNIAAQALSGRGWREINGLEVGVAALSGAIGAAVPGLAQFGSAWSKSERVVVGIGYGVPAAALGAAAGYAVGRSDPK